MNIPIHDITVAAAFILRGAVHLAGDELAAAPAALAAAAARGGFDTGALESNKDGLICSRADRVFGCTLPDGAAERLSGALRGIAGLSSNVLRNTKHFAAHKAARQTELIYFGHNESVHRFRAAEKDRILLFRRVFADQFGRDEAVLIALGLLVRQDMNDLDLRASRGNFVGTRQRRERSHASGCRRGS